MHFLGHHSTPHPYPLDWKAIFPTLSGIFFLQNWRFSLYGDWQISQWGLSVWIVQKSLYPFWFLESFLLIFIPHLTSYAFVSHKDECLGFIYILCVLLCCKERSVVCNKTKQKQKTPDKTQGSRGTQRKAVQSDASRCTWPWRSQATPTLVTGSAPRSPSCGCLRVLAPHFLKGVPFLSLSHVLFSGLMSTFHLTGKQKSLFLMPHKTTHSLLALHQ